MIYYVTLFLISLFPLVQLLWILYKRKFKGINDIPGPKDYPIIGNLLDIGLDTTAQWYGFLRITRTYKPFVKVWLGPNPYFASTDPEFTKYILSSFKYTKKAIEYEAFRPWLKNGLILNYGKSWQKRRKMITPAFNLKVLEDYSIVFSNKVDGLIKELSKHVNKEDFDVFPYAANCVIEIICETAMGISIADSEVNKLYIECVERAKKLIINRVYSLWKRFDILYKLTPDYQIQKQIDTASYDITSAIVNERRRMIQESNNNIISTKKKQVFLDTLLTGTIDGKHLTHDEVQEEVQNFMAAGHDTSTSFISFALYALSKEPDIQEKIYEEVKQIFGNNKNYQPTLQEMNDMHYTDRVLKEVHRLYPSAPYIGRQLEEDLHYKDMVIPKNTTIIIPIFCIHRRDDLFPDPEKFDPDRFLSTELIDKYSYIPFSAGFRNCIGQKFAMYEVKCAISKLIMNFKILPCDPKNEVEFVAEVVLSSRTGVHIKLINREDKQ